MQPRESRVGRSADRTDSTDSAAKALLLLVGLVVLEVLLLRFGGSPAEHLRVVRRLGDPAADPVAALLDLLAAVAEATAAYLVAVVALRLLARLPGFAGQFAAWSARLVTLPAARRALDAVLGTALVAQVAFNPLAAHAETLPPTSAHRPVAVTAAAKEAITGNLRAGSGQTTGVNAAERAITGNLRAGTAGAADTIGNGVAYTVKAGDTLWGIAAAHLSPAATPAEVDAYWRQLYAANQDVVGVDAGLIQVGQRLVIPVFQPRV